MIENLRKYPGIIIAALVAVFIGFILMDQSQLNSRGGGKSPVKSINGKSYGLNDYMQYAAKALPMAVQTSNLPVQYAQYDPFIGVMASDFTSGATQATNGEQNFFINHIFLLDAAKQFGITPSEQEIDEAIQKLPRFQNQENNSFDVAAYQKYLRDELGSRGTEKDFRSSISLRLIFDKLSKILGDSIPANADAIKNTHLVNSQRITATYATIPLTEFTEKQKPTDEELSKRWEESKSKYMTPTRRKFSYFIAKPKYPAGAEKKPEPPKPANPGDPTPEPSEADKKINADRANAEKQLALDMNLFTDKLIEQNGEKFEDLVKEKGWEIKATDLITKETIPTDLLALTPRRTQANIQDTMFNITPSADPLTKYSDALPVGDGDWIYFRLDGEEPAREKTFDESKEDVRKELIDEKAREEMKKSAEEKIKTIQAALDAKKSFADAAKEVKLTTQTVGPMANGETPAGHVSATAIATAAKLAAPSTLLKEPILDKDTAIIAFLDKREIYKDPNLAQAIEQQVKSASAGNATTAINEWFRQQHQNAKIEFLSQQ